MAEEREEVVCLQRRYGENKGGREERCAFERGRESKDGFGVGLRWKMEEGLANWICFACSDVQ